MERALVIGASSGIGEALSVALGARGARVALVARREVELQRVAARVREAGGEALVKPHDVRAFAAAPPLFDGIVADLGGLDLVAYVAGVMPAIEEHEYDFEKDRAMVEVNLLGAMAWMNLAAAHFEARSGGTLIGISSFAGERGRRGMPAYCASKAGLTAYLEGLRNRLARYGVRVVTVKPGPVDTPMTAGLDTPTRKVTPEEVAQRTLALAGGSRSGFVPAHLAVVAGVLKAIPSAVFRRLELP
jgi:NAD(P)-dependent dehydrogenase (short-subunit alcohol dehydrogenase family)